MISSMDRQSKAPVFGHREFISKLFCFQNTKQLQHHNQNPCLVRNLWTYDKRFGLLILFVLRNCVLLGDIVKMVYDSTVFSLYCFIAYNSLIHSLLRILIDGNIQDEFK
ncbi:hypothetical protein AQUCO_02500324v1 [Aquilegia coerulea]|uniref:Uncharacterized protein n=1 Tax=Aquilegia coerulea TaxID=218851 RepID=A0A2G5DBC8_AQUCA|nr:hypothetical protein AQUCO_02500324v1 [Aquilegia coerulea]